MLPGCETGQGLVDGVAPLGRWGHPFYFAHELGVLHSRVRFALPLRIRFGDTYDRAVTIGTWLPVMPGQQMHNQSVNPSISLTTQLSIFVKGQVSVPPNPFGFGKRRDGIRVELAKFFAHGFAVITNNNCKNPYSPAQPYACTIPVFRVSFTRSFNSIRRRAR